MKEGRLGAHRPKALFGKAHSRWDQVSINPLTNSLPLISRRSCGLKKKRKGGFHWILTRPPAERPVNATQLVAVDVLNLNLNFLSNNIKNSPVGFTLLKMFQCRNKRLPQSFLLTSRLLVSSPSAGCESEQQKCSLTRPPGRTCVPTVTSSGRLGWISWAEEESPVVIPPLKF